MEKIIFSKYSNDRNVNFKIRTDIYEDETGARHVRKVGMTKAAEEHIRNLHQLYCDMKEQFNTAQFELNQSTLLQNGLEFEYLTGEMLETQLDELLEQKAYTSFENVIKKYAENVRKMATEAFVPNEMYHEVFGEEADVREGQLSMVFNDIDMVFSNILVDGQRWVVCDYEWTFRFPIPVDFILFRTIHYYVSPNRKRDMGDLDLYELMGIDCDRVSVYEKMEQCFQQYVAQGNKPIWKLYETMGKETYFPQGLVAYAAAKKQVRHVEIVKYYEDDTFVSERQDLEPDEHGNVHVRIDLDSEVKTLRIDPASEKCIVKINSIIGIKDENYDIQYGCNGVSRDNMVICFDTEDPQILIGDLREGITAVEANYRIEYLDVSMDDMCNIISEFNELRGDLYQAGQRINDLEQHVSNVEHQISSMEQSVSWKVTKPLRSVREAMGGKDK